MNRAELLRADFLQRFDAQPEGVWAAPGRVNLIGEHTDYNEGFVLPFAIDRQTQVAVSSRTDRTVRIASTFAGADSAPITTTVDALKPETTTGWSAYPLGVVWALRQSGVDVSGFEMLIDSDVPVGAGLSSSAAIECAAALALNELADARLTRQQLSRIGQLAENDFVGAPTGIMDQSASLLGHRGSAVFLDCRSGESILTPFDVAGAGLNILVIDTKVSHSHATGGYAARRASCEHGARTLGVDALRDVGSSDLPRAATLLDEETFRRVRHIVTENERVLQTVAQLGAAGPASIGQLLDESHRSMRDDFEISCPELNLAVNTSRAHGALGARMTGGGFGGSAIALTPLTAVDSVRRAVIEAFAAANLTAPDIFVVQPSEGAQRVL